MDVRTEARLGKMREFGAAFYRLLFLPRTYNVLSWLTALSIAGSVYFNAWIHFNVNTESTQPGSKRRDGNNGHCMIDFGGQWLMGRMLTQGHGQSLYLRRQQREVLEAAYPKENQAPDAENDDAASLMDWLMGEDAPDGAPDPDHWQLHLVPGIGGQLYPPINGLVNYPVGLFRPQIGYRINQALSLVFGFAAGLAGSLLSRRRIWWPVAATFFIIFPGFAGSINLGQNAALTLAILLWGWLLISRGYALSGGLVWGMLAFKPVWGASFFLALLFTRRWKTALAMAATGLGLALATVPFVGWHSWIDWFNIARDGTRVYETDQNWIFLSRDLLSIPRRWLLNFKENEERLPHPLLTALIGWWSIAAVFEITWRLTSLRKEQAARDTEGPAPAFLLLSSWLLCFHFMYYDVLLAAFPVFLLLTYPRKFLVPRFILIFLARRIHLGDDLYGFYKPVFQGHAPPPVPVMPILHRHVWVLNSLELTLVFILLLIPPVFPQLGISNPHGTPWETFVLIGLWLWCGWTWLRDSANHKITKERKDEKNTIPILDVVAG
jgi:arabinofuranan 3-O-arabinosyltransferase